MRTNARTGKLRQALCLLGLACAAPALAQQTVPTLDGILHQLQNNLDQYRKLVPSFYCNEHVVSDANYAGEHQWRATDSIFRVARNEAGRLIESREVRAINGAPVSRRHLDGPVTLGGVFTGGLVTVSESGKACMQYTLQPDTPAQSRKTIVVSFSTLPDVDGRPECVLREAGGGRVLIDPVTMQVTKMELQAPHHGLNTGEHGLWKISLSYAPVVLGDKTFWMPAILNSTLVTDDKKPTIYSYFARYYDYHKLEVTSRIVPDR